MTYSEIVQIEKYIERIKKLECASIDGNELQREAETLDLMISSSIQYYAPIGINWDEAFEFETGDGHYNKEKIKDILRIMGSALKGILLKDDNYLDIQELRKDINSGKQTLDYGEELCEKEEYYDMCANFIIDMVIKYNSVFTSEQLNYFNAHRKPDDAKRMVGVLEKHMYDLCKTKISLGHGTDPNIVINNNNTANGGTASSKSISSIDVDIAIDIAIESIKEVGLSDAQTKEVVQKIEEIRAVNTEKLRRSEKWAKLKDILKWVVEQGFAVASLIIPLISQTIKP